MFNVGDFVTRPAAHSNVIFKVLETYPDGMPLKIRPFYDGEPTMNVQDCIPKIVDWTLVLEAGKCPLCKGVGTRDYLDSNGIEKVECPRCHGEGTIE